MDALATLKEIAQHHIVIAGAVFVLMRAACTIIPWFIGAAVDLAGIAVLGTWAAFGLAEVGIMLGACTAFGIARRLRPHVLRWRWLASRVTLWETHLRTNERFAGWIVIRLLGNIAFDPICYAAGLTGVSFGMFFWTTLLGNIPLMALFFFFGGQALYVNPSLGFAGLILLAFVAILAYQLVLRRRQ